MSKLLPIILLVLGLVAAIYLVTSQTRLKSKASPLTTPTQVTISNISDNSFTVSWLSAEPATGFISYGKDKALGSAVSDDRDSGQRILRQTHHVTLQNLDPQTVYYFKIGSGAETYDNKGLSFSQKTGPVTDATPTVSDPAFGKVLDSQGQPVGEALIYLVVQNGDLLSTYTRDGKWLLTLNNTRSEGFAGYLSYSTQTPVEVQAVTVSSQLVKHLKVGELTAGYNLSFKPDEKSQVREESQSLVEAKKAKVEASPSLNTPINPWLERLKSLWTAHN